MMNCELHYDIITNWLAMNGTKFCPPEQNAVLISYEMYRRHFVLSYFVVGI
jgi:hypothetical protein